VPFKTILVNLMDSVPGATGAILVDWEGEAVEQSCLYDIFDLKVVGAHKSILMNLLKEAHQSMGSGEIRHMVITTERQHYLTGSVGAEYSLVMTLDRSATVGLAIRHFKFAIDRMYKEIY